jgi:hypothetical protein
LSCEIGDRAARTNDPLATHNEIAEKIQFINSCKLVLLMAGFNVEMLRKAVPIDDSEA